MLSIQNGFCRLLSRKYDVNAVMTLIEKYRVICIFLAPFQVLDVVQNIKLNTTDISSLKILMTGGARIFGDQILNIRKFFPGK